MKSFQKTYEGLNVLVTGHTGFKGSWLSLWLNELGANVIGYALEPPTEPNNFKLSGLERRIIDNRGDVRDLEKFKKVVKDYQPIIIFHLAAQPIVLRSLDFPKETIDINSGGTVNMLESARSSNSVKAVVCVTSDKCYENQGWIWGYRESDLLGGHDPYSASKSMAEIAISSYRNSFFSEGRTSISSVRAGNVIGGGDFAEFRLIPDCMRSLLCNEPIILRNPQSTRPWQYVLESLSGYLLVCSKMLNYGNEFAEAWNFGPIENTGISAQEVVEECIKLWGRGTYKLAEQSISNKERTILKLNWDKAALRLNWHPVYNWKEALQQTISWFKIYEQNKNKTQIDMYGVCKDELVKYTEKAKDQRICWAE